MKIGLLSGTFDPVHDGHVALAEAALGAVDEVWFLPEQTPRNKQDVTDYKHRVLMLQLAVDQHKELFVVESKQAQHSVQTLNELTLLHPEHSFTLILGADTVIQLPNWQSYSQIIDSADILSFGRNGQPADMDFNHNASSKTIRESIAAGNVVEHLPTEVLDYIHEHKLYI